MATTRSTSQPVSGYVVRARGFSTLMHLGASDDRQNAGMLVFTDATHPVTEFPTQAAAEAAIAHSCASYWGQRFGFTLDGYIVLSAGAVAEENRLAAARAQKRRQRFKREQREREREHTGEDDA